MRRFLLFLLLCSSLLSPLRAAIADDFANPVLSEARPWCFWYWMYGAVTREGITTDLEAMAQVGLGGAYLMPIRSKAQRPELGGTLDALSDEWYDMVDWAMQEADRLGLQLGLHISDGFALAGGPWITPAESMQRVMLTAPTDTTGTTIGIYSVPVSYLKGEDLFAPVPSTRPTETCTATVRGHGNDLKLDTIKGGFSAKQPCEVTYTFPKAITASALELVLPSTQFQAHRLQVLTSDDGVTFTPLLTLTPSRTGWQNYDYNTTYSIPTTTTRYWRFQWTPEGTEPGAEDLDQAKWSPSLKVKEIRFHAAPRVNGWEGKAGLVWRITPASRDILQDYDYIPRSSIRRHVSAYSIPSDPTRVAFRLASVSTGQTNATGGAAKGLECDKFNPVAVRKQLSQWFGSHFDHPDTPDHSALAYRVLKYLHVDSWECGSQNWSPAFATEFKKRRGYDLMEYLPLLVGLPIENAETTDRVLRDVRRTIAELIEDVFYTEIRRYALLHDCTVSAESVCPTMVSDGMAHYRYADIPMGEFWLQSPTHDKPSDMLDAISGGHVYGKRFIGAEGFTQLRCLFSETPALVKPLLDRAYCLGINRLFYHVFCHNPHPEERPGMTLDGIGLFFGPANTWFADGGAALTRYATRCQYLLSQGRPVVDCCVYTGDEMPRRSFTPDRLVHALPGLFGTARVSDEARRLQNEGVPVEESPVGVKHSRNMLTWEGWENALHGYRYDSYNADALLSAKIQEGCLTHDSYDDAAVRYRLLILPAATPMNPDGLPLSPEVSDRLNALKQQGLRVLDVREHPWTENDLTAYRLDPDVQGLPAGIDFCHRSAETMEIYFLANSADTAATFRPVFRDSLARRAEAWDALTGTISRLPDDGRVTLAPHGSLFVVFPEEATPAEALTPLSYPDSTTLSLPLDTEAWTLTFETTGQTLSQDTLPDWSQLPDDAMRYYAGTVHYTTTFSNTLAPSHAQRVFLSLQGLHDIATVTLNGQRCGTVWTAPYEVDITEALRQGENTLEIAVTNTWANAILGHDTGHDPFPHISTNAKYRLPQPTLQPAGLLGPLSVTIR